MFFLGAKSKFVRLSQSLIEITLARVSHLIRRTLMQYYSCNRKYYCGIDLHAKTMYVCIINDDGEKVFHKNIDCNSESFLSAIAPFREELVVGVEGMFCWYWLGDLCQREGIEFVLGHALYMRAVHGAKTKNDKVDSERIALLLKSGMFPKAYAYPAEMRATRDLLRRRLFTVRKRSELLAHIKMTHQQYNAPVPSASLGYATNRNNLEAPFIDPSAKRMVESDSHLLEVYQKEIQKLEYFIKKKTLKTGKYGLYFSLLKTTPGIGDVLSLTMLYEIHKIERFPSVQKFCSYARLVKPVRSSSGKRTGGGGGRIGNQHLKWAFSEAAILLIRNSERAKEYLEKLKLRYPVSKAISIIAHRLGIAVYFMLKRREAFNEAMFFRI